MDLRLLLLSLLVIPVSTAYAYIDYNDVPEEPVVGFTFSATKIVQPLYDFTVSVDAFDSRNELHPAFRTAPLLGANVTISITEQNSNDQIEMIEGKTNKRGHVALFTNISTHVYELQQFYNATISVQYGDSIEKKSVLFYTTQSGAGG